MQAHETIYILGSGAVGFPLAAYLAHAGRHVVAVRTSADDVPKGTVTINVENGSGTISVTVETISLTQLTHVDGLIVIAAKSHANQVIAQALQKKGAKGPIVIMQNGIGVEAPFLETLTSAVYRCVLYITSQADSGHGFTFRPVTSSPLGVVRGGHADLARCIKELSTDEFPFRAEANIQREIWKKAIINTTFNSICPLLDIDNGVFVRDDAAADLARQLVRECLMVTQELDIDLDEAELMSQIAAISTRSDGQLISTLQDIRRGRQTEMQYLNLEIARIAATMQPALHLPKTELLGKMVVAKSNQSRLARQ